MMRRRTTALLALLLALAPLAGHADHRDVNAPWPNALPPRPLQERAALTGRCSSATPDCVDKVIARMRTAWRPLDRSCSHRAVFALTYLVTTQAFREALDENTFRDEPWMIRLDVVFADLYFDAIRRFRSGDPNTPPAWRIAFAAADGRRTNAGQDVFLGMNAHIQRDLPVALYRMGLTGPAGSRKPDHDRVNEILSGVLDEIQDEIARRYDPLIALTDAKPSPADELGALEILKSWREGAWRNAERLSAATSGEEFAGVMASIERNAEAWARTVAASDWSRYAPLRLEHCRAAKRRGDS